MPGRQDNEDFIIKLGFESNLNELKNSFQGADLDKQIDKWAKKLKGFDDTFKTLGIDTATALKGMTFDNSKTFDNFAKIKTNLSQIGVQFSEVNQSAIKFSQALTDVAIKITQLTATGKSNVTEKLSAFGIQSGYKSVAEALNAQSDYSTFGGDAFGGVKETKSELKKMIDEVNAEFTRVGDDKLTTLINQGVDSVGKALERTKVVFNNNGEAVKQYVSIQLDEFTRYTLAMTRFEQEIDGITRTFWVRNGGGTLSTQSIKEADNLAKEYRKNLTEIANFSSEEQRLGTAGYNTEDIREQIRLLQERNKVIIKTGKIDNKSIDTEFAAQQSATAYEQSLNLITQIAKTKRSLLGADEEDKKLLNETLTAQENALIIARNKVESQKELNQLSLKQDEVSRTSDVEKEAYYYGQALEALSEMDRIQTNLTVANDKQKIVLESKLKAQEQLLETSKEQISNEAILSKIDSRKTEIDSNATQVQNNYEALKIEQEKSKAYDDSLRAISQIQKIKLALIDATAREKIILQANLEEQENILKVNKEILNNDERLQDVTNKENASSKVVSDVEEVIKVKEAKQKIISYDEKIYKLKEQQLSGSISENELYRQRIGYLEALKESEQKIIDTAKVGQAEANKEISDSKSKLDTEYEYSKQLQEQKQLEQDRQAAVKRTISLLEQQERLQTSSKQNGEQTFINENNIATSVSELNSLYNGLLKVEEVNGKFEMSLVATKETLKLTDDEYAQLTATMNQFNSAMKSVEASRQDAKLQEYLKKAIADTKEYYTLKLKVAKLEQAGAKGAEYQQLLNRLNDLQPKIEGYADSLKDVKTYTDTVNKENTKFVDGMAKIRAGADRTGASFGSLAKKITEAFERTVLYSQVYNILNKVEDVIVDTVNKIRELDTAMTDIQVVTGQSDAAVRNTMTTYSDLAKQLGATTTQVSEGAIEWLRQGKTVEDTTKLLTASTMLSKLGMLESTEATELLTATLNGFKLSANEAIGVVDKLSAVDLKFATSTGEIATALQYVASSADSVGLDFDKLVGLITVGSETTRLSAETIGNAWKTLVSRLTNVKMGKFLSDDGEDLNNVETILGSFNIKLRDSQNEWRDMSDVIDELGSKWKSFTSVEKSAIATQVAGVRQANIFIATMDNYDKVMKATEVSATANGTANQKYADVMESIDAKINQFIATWEKLVNNLNMSSTFAGLVDAGTNFISILDFLINDLNILSPILASVGAMLTTGLFSKGLAKLGNAISELSAGGISKAVSSSFDKIISENYITIGENAEGATVYFNNLNKSLGDTVDATGQVSAGFTTMGAAVGSVKTSMNAAQIAAVGLQAAMGWITLVAAAVGIAVSAFQGYQRELEETRRAAIEAQEEIDNLSSSTEDQISKIKDLTKVINDSNTSQEEARSAREDLCKIQKELYDSYGKEAEGIDLVNGRLENNTALIDKAILAKQREQIQYNRESYNKAKDFMEENTSISSTMEFDSFKARTTDRKNLNNYINALKEIKSIATDLGASSFALSDSRQFTHGFDISFSGTREEILSKYDQLYDAIVEKYGESNELVINELTSLSNTMKFINDDNYKEQMELYNYWCDYRIKTEKEYVGDYEKVMSAITAVDKAKVSGSKFEYTTAIEAYAKTSSEILAKYSGEGVSVGVRTAFENLLDNDIVIPIDVKLKNEGSGYTNLTDGLSGLRNVTADSLEQKFNEWLSSGKTTTTQLQQEFEILADIMEKENIADVKTLIDLLVELGTVKATPEVELNADNAKEKVLEISTAIKTIIKAQNEYKETGSLSAKTILELTNNAGDYANTILEATNMESGFEEALSGVNSELATNKDTIEDTLGSLKVEYSLLSNKTKLTHEQSKRLVELATEIPVYEQALNSLKFTQQEVINSQFDYDASLTENINTLQNYSEAIKQQNDKGSITASTLQKLQKATKDWTKLVTIENGVIKLNSSAVQDMATSSINALYAKQQVVVETTRANIAAYQAEITAAMAATSIVTTSMPHGVGLAEAKLSGKFTDEQLADFGNQQSLLHDQEQALKTIETLKTEFADGIKVDTGSDSGSGDSGRDAWQKAYDEELKVVEHSKAMEQITEGQYISALDALWRKYFKDKSQYRDDDWKAQENLFKLTETYQQNQVSKLLAENEHAYKLGEISEQEYQDKKKEISDNYYKDKEKYLKEYQSSEEDSYNYRKALEDKAFKNLEHSYKMGEISTEQYWNKYFELSETYYNNVLDREEEYMTYLETQHDRRLEMIDEEISRFEQSREVMTSQIEQQKQNLNTIFTQTNGENTIQTWGFKTSDYEAVANNIQTTMSKVLEKINVYRSEKLAQGIKESEMWSEPEIAPLVKQYMELQEEYRSINQQGFRDQLEYSEDYISRRNALNDWVEDSEVEALKRVIQHIDDAYKERKLTDKEYYDLRFEWINKLVSAENDAASKINEANKQSYDDLNDLLTMVMNMIKKNKEFEKEALQTELDAYKKKIDLQKEALDLKEKERDYQNELTKKEKEITKIRDELLKLQYDDSAEATAKRLKLEETLDEKTVDLEETQHDKEVEKEKEALDDEYERFETLQKDRIKVIEKYLSQEGKIRQDANALIQNKTQALYEQLIEYNRLYGNSTETEIKRAWDSAYSAMQTYGEGLYDILGTMDKLKLAMDEFEQSSKNLTYSSESLGIPEMEANPNVDYSGYISQMKANSAKWQVAPQSTSNDINNPTVGSKQWLQLQNQNIVRDNNLPWVFDPHTGRWYTDATYTTPAYAEGGVGDKTGLAMLHGSSTSAETIFNAADSKKLYEVVHNTPSVLNSILSKLFIGNSGNTSPIEVNFGDIVFEGKGDNITREDLRTFGRDISNSIFEKINAHRSTATPRNLSMVGI